MGKWPNGFMAFNSDHYFGGCYDDSASDSDGTVLTDSGGRCETPMIEDCGLINPSMGLVF